MSIDVIQLKTIISEATPENINLYIEPINTTLVKFDINSKDRISGFISQVGHESGYLKYSHEIWGKTPTPDQAKYERDFNHVWPPTLSDNVNHKAFQLGNSEKGDGIKFKGRGLIQITGRSNYIAIGKALGIDLINHPELLETPLYAAMSAGYFWNSHNLNEICDKPENWSIKLNNGKTYNKFEYLTLKINGGQNGLADRLALYNRALIIIK